MRSAVAVASHSFPKNQTLRAELLARYPDSVFNESRAPLIGSALLEFLNGFEKAITGLEILDESVFASVPSLKVVSKYGVGLDTIDIEAAERHGVSVRWTPGVNRQSVAELAIAFMIMLGRNVAAASADLRRGIWTPGSGRQLSSATIGILGCGHVGQTVARLSRAFGASVLAHDIRNYDEFYRENQVVPVSLDALLAQSDFVSVHVPLDESTRGLIGARELAKMKRTACLVNTARGGIVDEAALKHALVSGVLAGAASDVFSVEPPADTELLLLPNFVATPHIGGSSTEAVLAMGRAAIAGLDDETRTISSKIGRISRS
jgi:phosphoglycerate dehydrogenase-like enzyme